MLVYRTHGLMSNIERVFKIYFLLVKVVFARGGYTLEVETDAVRHATVGDNVTFKCRHNVVYSPAGQFLEGVWSKKEGQAYNAIFLLLGDVGTSTKQYSSRIEHVVSHSSVSIKLTDVQVEDSGRYRCTISKTLPLETHSNTTELVVVARPVISIDMPREVQINTEFDIKCIGENASGPLWTSLAAGRNVLSAARSGVPTYGRYNATTSLKDAVTSRTKSVLYSCIVTWEQGPENRTAYINRYLSVKYPAHTSVSVDSALVEGSNVTLRCNVLDASPQVKQITWTRNDIMLPTNASQTNWKYVTVHGGRTLTIVNFTLHLDTGTYKCFGLNSVDKPQCVQPIDITIPKVASSTGLPFPWYYLAVAIGAALVVIVVVTALCIAFFRKPDREKHYYVIAAS